MGCTPSCGPKRLGQPQHFDVRPQSRPFQGQGNPLDALRRMSADEEAAEAVGKGALLSSRPQNESPMWKPARHFSSVVEKPIADSDSPSMTKDPQGDGSDGVNQKGVERSGSKTVNMSGQQEPALESSGDQVGNTDLVEKAGGEPVEATQNLQKSSEKPEKASSRGSVTPRRLTRGLSKNSSIQSGKQGSLKPIEAVLPSLRKSSAAGNFSQLQQNSSLQGKAADRLMSVGSVRPSTPPDMSLSMKMSGARTPSIVLQQATPERSSWLSTNLSQQLSQKRSLSLTQQNISPVPRQIYSVPVSARTTPSPHALSSQPPLQMAISDGAVVQSQQKPLKSLLKKNRTRRKGSHRRRVSMSPAITEVLAEDNSDVIDSESLPYIEPLGYGACLRPLKEKTSLKTVAQLDSVGVASVTPTITQDVAETAAIRNFVTSEAIPADVTQMAEVKAEVKAEELSVATIQSHEALEVCHIAMINEKPGMLIYEGENFGSVIGSDTATVVPPIEVLGESKTGEMCMRPLKYKLPLEEATPVSPQPLSTAQIHTEEVVNPSDLGSLQILGEWKSSERCVRKLKLPNALEDIVPYHHPSGVTLYPTTVVVEKGGPLESPDRLITPTRLLSARQQAKPNTITNTTSNQLSATRTSKSETPNQLSAPKNRSKVTFNQLPVARNGRSGSSEELSSAISSISETFNRRSVNKLTTSGISNQLAATLSSQSGPSNQLSATKTNQNGASNQLPATVSKSGGTGGGPMFRRHTIIKVKPANAASIPALSAAPKSPTLPLITQPSQSSKSSEHPATEISSRSTSSKQEVKKVVSISKEIFGPNADRHSPSGF